MALHQNELWKHGADDAAADRSHGSHSATARAMAERIRKAMLFYLYLNSLILLCLIVLGSAHTEFYTSGIFRD